MPVGFLRTHWRATLVAVVLFLIGIGIGAASGGSTKTETRTVASPTVTRNVTDTVTSVQTVRNVVVRVGRVAHTQAALSFSGNGGLTLNPFVLDNDATMYWTDDGTLMQIFNNIPSSSSPPFVNSNGPRGHTYMPAGRYELKIIAVGNWTIRIR